MIFLCKKVCYYGKVMDRLSEDQIVKRLQKLEIQPFSISWQAAGPNTLLGPSMRRYKPDGFVDIEWGKRKFRFIAEIRSVSTPKMIDQAIWQLLEYLKYYETRELISPLIVAPYLNEATIAELARREISGIDLSGNYLLIVPGELFVSKSGLPNKFPSNAPIKNIYRGTSSIVGRVFFSKPEFASVTEVLWEIKHLSGATTLSTVSKVLKTLQDDLIISRRETIKLIDPGGLLKRLSENYRPPSVIRRKLIKAAEPKNILFDLSENCDDLDLLSAVEEPSRYAVFPRAGIPTRMYVENLDKAMARIEFEETDRFADLELVEVREAAVYFDRRLDQTNGIFFTSPLQSYLDLKSGGKREQDVAKQIEEDLLKVHAEVVEG